jgi:protein TonB
MKIHFIIPLSFFLILNSCSTNTDTTIYKSTEVEISPEFHGGYSGFMIFIKNGIDEIQRNKGEKLEGKIYIDFIVDKSGSIINASILGEYNQCCKEEIEELINRSPKWRPGEINNQSVSVKLTVPIKFK